MDQENKAKEKEPEQAPEQPEKKNAPKEQAEEETPAQRPPDIQLIKDPWHVSARLRVGLAVLLRRPMGGGDFWCTLAGWDRGEWLLLNSVERLVLSGSLMKGAGLDFRFLSRGAVHGFSAAVRALFIDPPLLMVGWPQTLQVLPLSGEKRSEVFFEVEVMTGGEEDRPGKQRAQVLDISRHGCQIELPRLPLEDTVLSQGDRLSLVMPLPGEDTEARLEAEVRSVAVFRDSLNVGLKFTAGQEAVTQRIARILERQF